MKTKNIMKTRTEVRLVFANMLKLKPRELDFYITPVLIFSQADERELNGAGIAWVILVSWGYWAWGFGVYTANLGLKP